MSIYRSLTITVSFLGARKRVLNKETLIMETSSVGFGLGQWIIDGGMPPGSCLVYYDSHLDQYHLIIRPGMQFSLHIGALFMQGNGGLKPQGKSQKRKTTFQDFVTVPCPPGATATIRCGRYAFECRFMPSGNERRARKKTKLPPFTNHHFFPTSRWPEYAREDWNQCLSLRNQHDAWHMLGVNGSPLEVLTRLFHDFTPEVSRLRNDPGLKAFRALFSRLPEPSSSETEEETDVCTEKKPTLKTRK